MRLSNIGEKVALPLGDLPVACDLPVVSTYLRVIKALLLFHLFQSGSESPCTLSHMSSAGVFH